MPRNFQTRMPKAEGSPNIKCPNASSATAAKPPRFRFGNSGFAILSSFVIRHSEFGICHRDLSALDGPVSFGMFAGTMSRHFSTAGAEFLEHYQRDVPARWSPADLAAQREFVNAQIAGRRWLDWSTPAAALQLVQSAFGQTASGTAGKCEVVVLAGPVVELLEPTALFHQAASALAPGGKLIGIVPCLRDNSPESGLF